MGTIVLVIAAVLEVALAVYCIVTKSNQKRIRSFLRIGAFAVFGILAVTAVIKWSFRWELLAMLLLICALIGGVSLIRKREDKKKYNGVRIVFKASAMLLMIVLAVMPALVFPQYKLPQMTGKHKINTASYTYTDDSRLETFSNKGEHRKITMKFYYPAEHEGKFPLVVFSHGAFGIRDSNTSTYMELASNGYVVCSIDHPYHSMYSVDTDGHFTMVDQAFMQEVIDVNKGVYDEKTEFDLTHKWLKLRTQDMNFALDTIVMRAKDTHSEEVYELIDTDRIGLMGHSLGGAASVQVGRERHDIGAIVNLDADLIGEYVDFVDGKNVINKEIYPDPILSIYTGDMMKGFAEAEREGVSVAKTQMAKMNPASYEVYFAGTNHMGLTDLPLLSPLLVTMISGSIDKISSKTESDDLYVIETMNSIVLKFFNCYLKGEGKFDAAGAY